MDLTKAIANLSERIISLKDNVQTEEATKHSFVMPFLQMLGYDVFDPNVIVPEYIADSGHKKGEKVDYAILTDGEPMIIIEVKKHSENLDRHIDQLYRYFSVVNNKFAILTNGIEYRFYTESETNRMDHVPFLTIDLLDPKKREIKELERFAKDELDTEKLMSLANKRKYINSVKEQFEKEVQNPSDEFIKYFAGQVVGGRMTQTVVDEFREYIGISFKEIILDLANKKINDIKSGLTTEGEEDSEQEPEVNDDGIVTTDEEITAFFIVKSILAEVSTLDKIVARDTKSYFGVLFEDNNRKWICRFHFNTRNKYIGIHEVEKEEARYLIEQIEDIYTYSDKIKAVVERMV